MSENKSKVLAGGIFISTIIFVLTIVVNALAGIGQKGLFHGRTSDVSKGFPTIITPSGWAFSIWSIIYIWLAISLGYLVVNTCRKKHNDPAIFSLSVSTVFILNMIFNMAWLFTWDRKNPVASSVLLFFIVISNWILLGLLSKRLAAKKSELSSTDRILYILLPQNGLATYTAWTTIASLVNLSIAVKYGGTTRTDNLGDWISLGLLSLLLLLWFPLENYNFFEPLQYVFTPYFVLVWALAGILSKLRSEETSWTTTEGIYITVLFGISIFLLLLRLLFIIFTHFKGHPVRKRVISSAQITTKKA